MEVKILGFDYTNDPVAEAEYLQRYKLVLKFFGYDLSICHLGFQVGDWTYHTLGNAKPSNRKAHWLKRKVSDRFYKLPDIEMTLGNTDKSLQDFIDVTADVTTPVWRSHVWVFAFGWIKQGELFQGLKKDCCTTTRMLINHALPDMPPLQSQIPYNLLKELENNGY